MRRIFVLLAALMFWSAPLPAAAQDGPEMVTLKSGLKYQDLREGAGRRAGPMRMVTVDYVGWLEDGTKFDSSYDDGRPFLFSIGAGSVIKGWDEGVAGMREGGKRRLIIPSKLGYGARGAGKVIPPNSTLIFDVELLEVK